MAGMSRQKTSLTGEPNNSELTNEENVPSQCHESMQGMQVKAENEISLSCWDVIRGQGPDAAFSQFHSSPARAPIYRYYPPKKKRVRIKKKNNKKKEANSHVCAVAVTQMQVISYFTHSISNKANKIIECYGSF